MRIHVLSTHLEQRDFLYLNLERQSIRDEGARKIAESCMKMHWISINLSFNEIVYQGSVALALFYNAS